MKITERTTYDAEFTREEHDIVHTAFKFFKLMTEEERNAFCCYMADCLGWNVDDFTPDFEMMLETLSFIADYI